MSESSATPDEVGVTAFDAFYRTTRERLLVQTLALTGDLPAARRAVRDVYVVAWHHWSKVSRYDDPETWARPWAWKHALRRHSTRPWRREKRLDPELLATLEALQKLSLDQRRVLLLNHLAALSLPDLAREAGLRLEVAEVELQAATATFSTERDVASTSIRVLLDDLLPAVAETRWPRHTIIRRHGAARRRLHTTLGGVAAVAALVATGSLVADPDGLHPTLAREHVAAAPDRPQPISVPDTALLAATAFGTDWSVETTHDNATGDGLVVPCQGARFADARGRSAAVREYADGSQRGYQTVEASATQDAARRAFSTTRDWYAGCTEPRTQLIGTYDVSGVGDEATLFLLRSWAKPVSTQIVGVARTGQLITTTATTRRGRDPVRMTPSATLLGEAVTTLCDLPYAGACTTNPTPSAADPLPVSPNPAMISEVDLPPLSGVGQPWMGSPAADATENVASTRCDQSQFDGSYRGVAWRRNVSRTFLIPDAGLPDEFGLTQTVGVLTPGSAARFVDDVRDKLGRCSAKDLGTKVERIDQISQGARELTAWRVTTEISDSRSVRYAMAILRDGARVSQLGFIAAPGADMTTDDFTALAERALIRLHRLSISR